jgi:alkylhydroperoxidase family enzyme
VTKTAGHAATWSVPQALRRDFPDAIELLAAANELAWCEVDPVRLELVRVRVAELLGNQAGLDRRSAAARQRGLGEEKIAAVGRYAESSLFTGPERDCLEFAEQFVLDVASMPKELVLRAGRHFPAENGLRTFAVALYITECVQRLEMIATRLLAAEEGDGAPDVPPPAAAAEAGMQATWWNYQACVQRYKNLDPISTELLRLTCARTHNCAICQQLRLADAVDAGADEDMTTKIDRFEQSDLPERTKVMLRIVRAFITAPGMLTDADVRAARSHFSDLELSEICLDVTKWSSQKYHVALGSDLTMAAELEVNEQGFAYFAFGSDGNVAWQSPRHQV